MVDEAACGGVNEAGGVHEIAFATVPGVVDTELVQVGGGDLRVEAAHHADLGLVGLVAGEGFEAQVVGCVHGEDEVVAVEVLDGEDAGAVRGRVDTAGGELRGGTRVDEVAFFFVADAAGGDGDGHAGFLGVLADEVFADGERQMLPVQTVMIRYMVLVYRWGGGWPDAVGVRGPFVGPMMGGCGTDGCARRQALAEAHLARAHEGARRPGRRGPAGPLGVSLIRFCFLRRHRNYLEALQAH